MTAQVTAYEADPVGVNAIGSWSATTGLAEAGRRSVEALIEAGVDVYLDNYDYGAPTDNRRMSSQLRSLPRGRIYPVDLCFLNFNEIDNIPDSYFRRKDYPSYLIGSWYWELPWLPRAFASNVRRVDEIWVASEFVRDALSGYTKAPIKVFSSVVEPVRDTALTRADFGLPEASCLFFFNFDANSTFGRKNPFGVIDAFKNAFPPSIRGVNAHLVVKAINLGANPPGRSALVYELEKIGGILIDDDLRGEEMAALIAMCDVYVSLHRAEGFGLGMAEAMYFGLPVIGTSYSGNVDFMTASNSCPVSYRLREVEAADLIFNPEFTSVYEPGQLWAEPDQERATWWMKYLYEHPFERTKLGAKGAASIRGRCGASIVGHAMRDRLAALPFEDGYKKATKS